MTPFLAKFVEHDGGARPDGQKEKVCVIGSGSWGTALARLAAINADALESFDDTVNMWVRQREVRFYSAFFHLKIVDATPSFVRFQEKVS